RLITARQEAFAPDQKCHRAPVSMTPRDAMICVEFFAARWPWMAEHEGSASSPQKAAVLPSLTGRGASYENVFLLFHRPDTSGLAARECPVRRRHGRRVGSKKDARQTHLRGH